MYLRAAYIVSILLLYIPCNHQFYGHANQIQFVCREGVRIGRGIEFPSHLLLKRATALCSGPLFTKDNDFLKDHDTMACKVMLMDSIDDTDRSRKIEILEKGRLVKLRKDVLLTAAAGMPRPGTILIAVGGGGKSRHLSLLIRGCSKDLPENRLISFAQVLLVMFLLTGMFLVAVLAGVITYVIIFL